MKLLKRILLIAFVSIFVFGTSCLILDLVDRHRSCEHEPIEHKSDIDFYGDIKYIWSFGYAEKPIFDESLQVLFPLKKQINLMLVEINGNKYIMMVDENEISMSLYNEFDCK